MAFGSGALLQAAEATFSVSAALPEGAFPVHSVQVTGANNICKWLPVHEPGSQRELGQRIVTGRSPQMVNRLVLKVAEIQAAVGQDAPGSGFVFRLVRFSANNEIIPLSEPVLEATGQLPSELATGDYLTIDFPDTELEPAAVYGLEIGFTEPAGNRSINFETATRESYKPGRIYFRTNEPDAAKMVYVLRSANLVFHLGSK